LATFKKKEKKNIFFLQAQLIESVGKAQVGPETQEA
jgi:hypothetical protein